MSITDRFDKYTGQQTFGARISPQTIDMLANTHISTQWGGNRSRERAAHTIEFRFRRAVSEAMRGFVVAKDFVEGAPRFTGFGNPATEFFKGRLGRPESKCRSFSASRGQECSGGCGTCTMRKDRYGVRKVYCHICVVGAGVRSGHNLSRPPAPNVIVCMEGWVAEKGLPVLPIIMGGGSCPACG